MDLISSGKSYMPEMGVNVALNYEFKENEKCL